MTPRFAVRRATSDDGLTLYWLVVEKTGERLFSSVFQDTVQHYCDALNERHPAKATRRSEAGSWS